MCLFNHKTLPESLQFYCKMFFQAWTLLKIHNHTNTFSVTYLKYVIRFQVYQFPEWECCKTACVPVPTWGGRRCSLLVVMAFFPSVKGCDWHETLVWHLSITGMSDLNIRTLYKKKSISDSTVFFCMGYLCFPLFCLFLWASHQHSEEKAGSWAKDEVSGLWIPCAT